jgi:hypothetical protein
VVGLDLLVGVLQEAGVLDGLLAIAAQVKIERTV